MKTCLLKSPGLPRRELPAIILVFFSVPAIAAPATELPGFDLGMMTQLGLGLALIVGLIYALAWVTKKMPGNLRGESDALKIIGGVSVGARERVMLIKVNDEQVLIGVAPGHVSALHVTAFNPITVPEGETETGFSPVLKQFLSSDQTRRQS